MKDSLDLILENIKILINKVQIDKKDENELLINKIIKPINKLNNITNQINWEKSNKDKDDIDMDDIFEIQKILIDSINNEKNELNFRMENIKQFIKNINFILKNKDNKIIETENNIKMKISNNIDSIGHNINVENNEIKNQLEYIPKNEEDKKTTRGHT